MMLILLKGFVVVDDDADATFGGKLQSLESTKDDRPDITVSRGTVSEPNETKVFRAHWPRDQSMISGMLLWLSFQTSELVCKFENNEAKAIATRLMANRIAQTCQFRNEVEPRVVHGNIVQLLTFAAEVKQSGNERFRSRRYNEAMDLYFSSMTLGGNCGSAITAVARLEFFNLAFDNASNILQSCIKSKQERKAHYRLPIFLGMFRGMYSFYDPQKVGKWFYRCALIERKIGEPANAYFFVKTALEFYPNDDITALRDILEPTVPQSTIHPNTRNVEGALNRGPRNHQSGVSDWNEWILSELNETRHYLREVRNSRAFCVT